MRKLGFALLFIIGSVAMASFASAERYFGIALGNTDYGEQEDGFSYQITGGYSFNDRFSLQASYVDYGDIDDNFTPVWTIEADAIEIAGVGTYNLGQDVSLIGVLGLALWDMSITENGYGIVAATDGADLFYGIGLAFEANETMSFELKYKDYDISVKGKNVSVDNLSAGLKYRF